MMSLRQRLRGTRLPINVKSLLVSVPMLLLLLMLIVGWWVIFIRGDILVPGSGSREFILVIVHMF